MPAAARAVLETGEFDYAWNTQINPDVQAQMEAAGKGVFLNAFGTLVERIEMNMTDPSPEPARGRAFDHQASAPDPVGHPRAQGAVDGHRPQMLVDIGYGAAGRPPATWCRRRKCSPPTTPTA
jgi:peptide/nickel transport system substrate-binding protein